MPTFGPAYINLYGGQHGTDTQVLLSRTYLSFVYILQIDPQNIDTDGDGMYDEWEINYKLNPFRPDGFIDTDHDMFTNYQEYQNRTDPTLRSSHPPYPQHMIADEKEENNNDEEYRTVTITIVLVSMVLVLILILLAISKRNMIKMEVEEQLELEAEEMDYRQTLDRKKAERLSSMDKNK